jgi:hypothetical protein
VNICETPEDVIAAVFAERHRGAIWYAHNGGEYDYKYLLSALLKHQETIGEDKLQIHIITQGKARVIGFKVYYRNQTYEFRDSYALMPASLRTLTTQLAPEHLKAEFDHDHELFTLAIPDHRSYLETDVRGLMAVLLQFKKLIRETFGVDVGWTAASTALRAWLASLPKHLRYYRQPKRVREFCRRAYFGGMVALRDTNWHEDVTGVDVNAMYPYVMLGGVPCGFACYTTQYELDKPGIYHVSVTVPDDNVYPLAPYRDLGYGVAWPTGTFETYLCSKEIDDITHYGCSVTIIEGYSFERIEFPFETFVRKCERLELEHRGTALAMCVKIMRNSLYGKFGTRETTESYMLSEEQPELRTGRGENNDETQPFMPAINAVTGSEIPNLWTHSQTLDAAYLRPEWAAWITAGARCHNRAVAYAVGLEHWLYCDTDSNVFTSASVHNALAGGKIDTQPGYGHLKLEKTFVRFRALGPKVYAGVYDDGRYEVRCKGIPNRSIGPDDISSAFSANRPPVISYTGMNGTLQVIKRGAAYSDARQRTFPQLAHSRHWHALPDGAVRPIHLDGTSV